jgi:hypothetical protein
MALVLADRVKETAAAPGTGTVTLLGAEDGYQSFSAIGNTNTTYYTIADQSGSNWEVGIGTYTASGSTLTRDTVLSSSDAGALVNFSSGTQDVFVTYPSEFSQTAQVGDVKLSADIPIGPGTWLETGKYYSKAAYPALAAELGNVPDLGAPADVPQAQIPVAFATVTANSNSGPSPYLTATDGTVTVAIGASGAVRKTTDGVNWTPVASGGTTQTLNEIRYINNRFIVVGGNSAILSSTDGTTFAYVGTTSTTASLNSVAYGAGRYVAVGTSGVIISSANLVDWTLSTGTGANGFNRVVFAAGVFVAVGVSGACYSSTDGITWTARTAGSVTFNDVIFANSQFTAVCASQAYTSPDGITWAPNSFGIAGGPVATNGTLHVVVGASGQIRKSADGGETWSFVASPTSSVNAIEYINSRFVAFGGAVCSSTDGTTWTLDNGSVGALYSIAYGAGKYVGVGNTGLVRYSSDLVTWTTVSWPDTNRMYKVIFANGLFVTGSRNAVFTSPDGITWTTYTFTNSYPIDVAWTGSMFIVAASSVITSPDGITWTSNTLATALFSSSNIVSNGASTYVYGGNTTGNRAVSVYSTDGGATWNVTGLLPYGSSLSSTAWDGTQFVASAGSNMTGGYYTSTDGITWTAYATSQRTAITSVVKVGSKSFAVTSAGFSLLTGGPQVWKMKVGAWPYTVAASSAPNPRCLSYDGTGTYVLGGSMGATSPYPGILRSSDAVSWSGAFGINGINNVNVSYYLNGRWFLLGDGGYALSSTDSIAWTQSAFLGSAALNAMAFGASTYVVVGGTVRYSTNGTTWTAATAGAQTFNDVIFANSLFVAVGAAGTCYTSPDGITWTSQSAGSSAFNRLLYANSLFVAVGAAGTIYTSPDGTTWTVRTSNVAGELRDVVWDGAQYVAVGVSGSITTSPDGTTWTSRTSGVTDSLNSISWSGTRFVVTNTTNTNALVSTNGSSWTVVVTAYPTGNTLFSGYLGGKFVSVGANFTQYSSDGLTWSNSGNTQTAVGFGSNTPNQITYTNSQYVVVSNNGGIYTSSDATDWAARTSGTTRTLNASTWDGSNYVAVGLNGVYVTSPDGVTWTLSTDASLSSFYAVSVTSGKTVAFGSNSCVLVAGAARQEVLQQGTWAYTLAVQSATNPRAVAYNGSNLYVAAGSTGAILTSSDAVSWTGQNTNLATNFDKVAYLNGNWIAMGGTGSATNLLTSPDAITWTARTAGTAIYNYAAYGAGVYVVVGASGACFSSPDLATWTTRSAGAQTFNDVIFANSVFVAVGAAGSVYSSADGLTWTSRTAGSAAFLRIIYANSLFVAVGASGAVWTSPDGATWTQRTSNVSIELRDIVWSGSLFVAVGASGGITTSPDGVTWTNRTQIDTTFAMTSVSWTGTHFAATSSTAGRVWRSTDGITWTRTGTNGTSNILYSAYLGGKIVAMSSAAIQVSTDGYNWTDANQTQHIPTTMGRMYFYGGKYFALTNSGIYVSSDGLSFTSPFSLPRLAFQGLAYDGVKFVAVTSYSTASYPAGFYTSTDGVTWTKSSEISAALVSGGGTITATDLVYASGNFIFGTAVSKPNNIFYTVYTSPDAVTWTGRQPGFLAAPGATIATDGTTAVFGSPEGAFSSTDGGVTWSLLGSPTVTQTWIYIGSAWSANTTTRIFIGTDINTLAGSGITIEAVNLLINGACYVNGQIVGSVTGVAYSVNPKSGLLTARVLTNSARPVNGVTTQKEAPTRGNTMLQACIFSNSNRPALIAEYPLYSYNTATTFYVAQTNPTPGMTAYIYAGA